MVASDNIDHPVKGMKDRNLFEKTAQKYTNLDSVSPEEMQAARELILAECIKIPFK